MLARIGLFVCVCERECVCPEKLKLLFPGCIVNVSVCFTACLRGKHERMHNGRRPIAMVTGCKRMKECERNRVKKAENHCLWVQK